MNSSKQPNVIDGQSLMRKQNSQKKKQNNIKRNGDTSFYRMMKKRNIAKVL